MKRAYIRGTGSYLPERVMTNDDWAKLVDTSDQWITERSGIKERHFADPSQAASDLALIAAQNALKNAGVGASELDLVMVATISADHGAPPRTGIGFFSSFSTASNSPISAGAQKATAVSSAPARAVRPIRWT